MKTQKHVIVALMCAIGLIPTTNAIAQMSEYKFNQLFDQAFELVMEGNHKEAIAPLTELHLSDKEHGQVLYLLGMCKLKASDSSGHARKLLQKASARYDFEHQLGRVEDRSAPAKVWFYLAEACAATNHPAEAIEAYRNYMSCIPLATLDHKRMVISRISELRENQASVSVSTNGVLASQKP